MIFEDTQTYADMACSALPLLQWLPLLPSAWWSAQQKQAF